MELEGGSGYGGRGGEEKEKGRWEEVREVEEKEWREEWRERGGRERVESSTEYRVVLGRVVEYGVRVVLCECVRKRSEGTESVPRSRVVLGEYLYAVRSSRVVLRTRMSLFILLRTSAVKRVLLTRIRGQVWRGG